MEQIQKPKTVLKTNSYPYCQGNLRVETSKL